MDIALKTALESRTYRHGEDRYNARLVQDGRLSVETPDWYYFIKFESFITTTIIRRMVLITTGPVLDAPYRQ
jgi:hypothetical protein